MQNDEAQLCSAMEKHKFVSGLLKYDQGCHNIFDLSGIDARTTSGHCLQTSQFVFAVSSTISHDYHTKEALTLGGSLHDIGKLAIPYFDDDSSALEDKTNLRYIVDHPVRGARILRREADQDLENKTPLFKDWQWDLAIAITALHHTYKRNKELCYPHNNTIIELVDEGIIDPLVIMGTNVAEYGEILAVCDVYSAVSSNRHYSKDRLKSERLPNPACKNDDIKRIESIEKIVRFELNLSKVGEVALHSISKNYHAQLMINQKRQSLKCAN